MFNTQAVLSIIKPDDQVLDIGGFFQPFERANWVIDFLPYEGRKNGVGLCHEHFSKNTWVQQDICDFKKPFPFADKQFDFVNAGHVFEDLRDPIYPLTEMIRVAKRGYIEVPSRFMEQVLNLQNNHVCGFTHHRWIIDTVEDNIRLIFKNHLLHSYDKFHIKIQTPEWPHLNPNIGNFGFFWEGNVGIFEQESIFEDFYKDYFEATVKLSDSFTNLHNIFEPKVVKIKNPFKDDGKPHITLFNDLKE